MLLVKRVSGASFLADDTGDTLFNKNPYLKFYIKAPMYWWLDSDFEKLGVRLPMKNFEFCLDAWESNNIYIAQLTDILFSQLEPRQLLQVLPLSTYLEGAIELSYQKIVEICENYACGEYDFEELYNQWPCSREWTDFCETLMDITGVREIIEKEGLNNGK